METVSKHASITPLFDPSCREIEANPVLGRLMLQGFEVECDCITFQCRKPISRTRDEISILNHGPNLIGTDPHEVQYKVSRHSTEHGGYCVVGELYDIDNCLRIAKLLMMFPSIQPGEGSEYASETDVRAALAKCPPETLTQTTEITYSHPYLSNAPVTVDWIGSRDELYAHLARIWHYSVLRHLNSATAFVDPGEPVATDF